MSSSKIIFYRNRFRALQDAGKIVEGVISRLSILGLLQNTYIMIPRIMSVQIIARRSFRPPNQITNANPPSGLPYRPTLPSIRRSLQFRSRHQGPSHHPRPQRARWYKHRHRHHPHQPSRPNLHPHQPAIPQRLRRRRHPRVRKRTRRGQNSKTRAHRWGNPGVSHCVTTGTGRRFIGIRFRTRLFGGFGKRYLSFFIGSVLGCRNEHELL